jgi:hypothetical protein
MMKFKECISVPGELLNRDEIFGNLRDMQNIKKIKLRVRGRETSGTNVFCWFVVGCILLDKITFM